MGLERGFSPTKPTLKRNIFVRNLSCAAGRGGLCVLGRALVEVTRRLRAARPSSTAAFAALALATHHNQVVNDDFGPVQIGRAHV